MRRALFKGDKKVGDNRWANAPARIDNFHSNHPGAGVGSAHRDNTASGSEFGRVFEQIPEYLLKSADIAVDDVLRGGQFHAKRQGIRLDFFATNCNDVPKGVVEVGWLEPQGDLASREAVKVQQVIDEARLQLQVAADCCQVFANVRRQRRIGLAGANEHQRGSERRPQFVGKDGKKPILGDIGGQGGIPGLLIFLLHPFAVGDVLHQSQQARPPRRVLAMHPNPAHLILDITNAAFKAPIRTHLHGPSNILHHRWVVLFQHMIEKGIISPLRQWRFIANHRVVLRRLPGNLSERVQIPNAEPSRVQGKSEPLFCLAEGRFLPCNGLRLCPNGGFRRLPCCFRYRLTAGCPAH